MNFTLKFLILIWICAFAQGNVTPAKPHETLPKEQINSSAANKENTAEAENKLREKRQLTYIPTTQPIYFDNAHQQQQPGLLGLGQNIPILGTLVTGLPLFGNNQNLLSGLPGNLGNGLNGLTSALGLGNLGLLGGQAPSLSNAASCPASQKLSCRCEPLIPIKVRKEHNNDVIEIIDQSIRNNVDGSTEVVAHLSNGITMYQKSNNQLMSREIDGYYSLRVTEGRFLTIYYKINDVDYTVKAEVHTEPPKSEMETAGGQQNLIGNF